MISTIDTHTAGEPTRTVIGGIPYIPGATMSDKMLYLKNKMDHLRTMLVYEPRGNEVMSGAILTQPCDPQADMGVIYIEVGGYLPMCGHDTIGCCTAMVEAGIVPVKEPVTTIRLDTPAGLVVATVAVDDLVAKRVTFKNIPSFLYKSDVDIEVPDYGRITLDIAYGGNFYALVEAKDLGLDIAPEEAGDLVRAGISIRKAVNDQLTVRHPERSFIEGLTHVEFYGPPAHPEAHAKNAVVIPPGSIDRSPCGTGTSAKLAAIHAKGEWKVGQEFVHESIIGTLFRARIVEETKVGKLPAVLPEITGSAYVTGINQFVVDPADPLKKGFLLGRGD
jgi:proline racemase